MYTPPPIRCADEVAQPCLCLETMWMDLYHLVHSVFDSVYWILCIDFQGSLPSSHISETGIIHLSIRSHACAKYTDSHSRVRLYL